MLHLPPVIFHTHNLATVVPSNQTTMLRRSLGSDRCRFIRATPYSRNALSTILASHLDIGCLDDVFKSACAVAEQEPSVVPSFTNVQGLLPHHATEMVPIVYSVSRASYSGSVEWGTVKTSHGARARLVFNLGNNNFIYSPARTLFGTRASPDARFVSPHASTAGFVAVNVDELRPRLPALYQWALDWFPSKHRHSVSAQWHYNEDLGCTRIAFRLDQVELCFNFEPAHPLPAGPDTLWQFFSKEDAPATGDAAELQRKHQGGGQAEARQQKKHEPVALVGIGFGANYAIPLAIDALNDLVKESKPIVAFDDSLDTIKADADTNRKTTANVTVHEDIVDKLKQKLEDPNFMKAIVVRGPKNAGKSWTTRFALDGCDPKKLHVVWIKADSIASVAELADDLETAMGIKWHTRDARSMLLEKFFPPETTSATLTTRPLNDEHRLRRVLDILQDKARECKADGKKCVVLLDDFETAETAEDARRLNKAFRTIANTLASYAKNNILQPVIVSSDPNIGRYFPHRHDKQVVVGWLSDSDVRKYVEAFCGDNRTQEEIDKITALVTNNAGRLVYHVREACDAIKNLPKEANVEQAIKDVADATAHNDFVDIQTTVCQLGREAAVWQAIKAWRAHAVEGADGQYQIPPRVADTFSRDALDGVEILIRGGILYDAGNGTIKETSLSHRNVMDRLSDMFAPPRTGLLSWLNPN